MIEIVMNTHEGCRNSSKGPMPGDASKYNLRCNRNISEKMSKKDFVYDIRPPNQNFRKVSFRLIFRFFRHFSGYYRTDNDITVSRPRINEQINTNRETD